MPGRDRTGPDGEGPGVGRGLGPCQNDDDSTVDDETVASRRERRLGQRRMNRAAKRALDIARGLLED